MNEMSDAAWSHIHDALLKHQTGMSWAEIEAEHNMQCGGCPSGQLQLRQVIVTMTPEPPIRYDASNPRSLDFSRSYRFRLLRWNETVTVVVYCEVCGAELHMPLHTKE